MMEMANYEDLLVELKSWTFARWAFILPVINCKEISTSDMEKQDSAHNVTVPR